MKLLLAVAPSLAVAFLLQNMSGKPPMKMGLWETTSSSQMSGVDMPPGMPGMGARTIKIRACVTPESYAKAFNQQSGDCSRSNETWSGNTYSFDMSCRQGKTTGHFEMTFEGENSGHGKTHLVINPGAHPMTIDTTMTSQFLSADCGSVTPDKPQIMH
jgi:hypothetical protein